MTIEGAHEIYLGRLIWLMAVLSNRMPLETPERSLSLSDFEQTMQPLIERGGRHGGICSKAARCLECSQVDVLPFAKEA